jgi:hypothetical protein
LSQVPTNRKERIQAIRNTGTDHKTLKQIFDLDKNETVMRALVKREDLPESLLDDIYEWTAETRDSKFGPISDESGEISVFFPHDSKKQYQAYQIRYAALIDLAHRKTLPQGVAEKVSLDERHEQGAAMLAANGLLSEEFILKIFEKRPDARQYFCVFPNNNSDAVRAKLIDYLRESQNLDALDSFLVCQDPTPEELTTLREIFPSKRSSMTDEEKEADFEEKLLQMNNAHDQLYDDFYFSTPAEFLFRKIREHDQIFFRDIETLECHKQEWSWVINEYPQAFRAEYLRFSKIVTLEQMQEAARDDYYLPCFYLGSRPDIDPSVAEILMNDVEPFMRHVIAKNMAAPFSLSLKGLTDESPIVRIGFAQRDSLTVSELKKILQDPVPAVAQTPFNEFGHLPKSSIYSLQLSSGSMDEFLDLVQTSSAHLLPHLANLLGRTLDPNAFEANNYLASHPDANVRVEFIRPHKRLDFFNSVRPEVLAKLAGDKLSQVRKYVLQHSFDRDIQQADFPRLFASDDVSDLQKMVLAATVTDRKVFTKFANYPSDWVKLGFSLNWKATTIEKSLISFEEREFKTLAERLCQERDLVGDVVDRTAYMACAGWNDDLHGEELEAYWGGNYPSGWDQEEEEA